ncbi:hypothetical protein Tco_0008353 [Tanacetum coccineum]
MARLEQIDDALLKVLERPHMPDLIEIYSVLPWALSWQETQLITRIQYLGKRISKNLHPNDFEDLFSSIFKEKLNHLPKTDKTSLHMAVNMWIRNLVIRNRVGSYARDEKLQTKINLELSNWDAARILLQ